MIDLATLSGLGPALAATEATFAPRLARSAATTLRRLERAGLARTSTPPTLTLPRTFSATLAAAIALDPDSPLSWHYLDTMPSLHVEQLCTRAEPTATLLHTQLDWARLPRLSGAITRLGAILTGAGVDPATAFGTAELRAATLAELYPRTYYGGFMPLLYGYPADMAAMARALAAGDDVHTVIDTWLAAPLTHELSHLGAARTGIFPGYLDECIAGWLSVRALPAFAYPDAGAANAIFAAPWFLQIGQALARATSPAALIRAHAGVTSWDDALGPLADAVARLGWDEYLARRDPHFLSSNFTPEPWLKLFALAAAGRPLAEHTLATLAALPWADIPTGAPTPEDTAALADGLRAMCTQSFLDQGAYRVARRAPPPIRIDLDSATMSAPLGDSADPVPPRYPVPPALAAALRLRLPARFTLQLPPDADLDDAAARLAAGQAQLEAEV